MPKFRLYRKMSHYEYKDVEAVNEQAAVNRRLDSSESGWKITDSNYVSDWLLSSDLKKESGANIFNLRSVMIDKLDASGEEVVNIALMTIEEIQKITYPTR